MNTAEKVQRVTESATQATAIAMGTCLGGQPEVFKHIAMMGAATWLIHQAAMSAFLGFKGEQVRPDDPRVQALIHDWLEALKLYPDQRAVSDAMTAARDKAFPDV